MYSTNLLTSGEIDRLKGLLMQAVEIFGQELSISTMLSRKDESNDT